MSDKRDGKYTVKSAIDGPTCWQMISFNDLRINTHIYTSYITHLLPFYGTGKRSGHVNRRGFAEELVFTSCHTATQGERARDSGEARRAGTVTVTQPQP